MDMLLDIFTGFGIQSKSLPSLVLGKKKCEGGGKLWFGCWVQIFISFSPKAH